VYQNEYDENESCTKISTTRTNREDNNENTSGNRARAQLTGSLHHVTPLVSGNNRLVLPYCLLVFLSLSAFCPFASEFGFLRFSQTLPSLSLVPVDDHGCWSYVSNTASLRKTQRLNLRAEICGSEMAKNQSWRDAPWDGCPGVLGSKARQNFSDTRLDYHFPISSFP
jgi:hypothetical protein